jgi:dihydropteroate synthase
MRNSTLSLRCKDRLLSLEQPLVMAILNLTEDSFYEGSRSLPHTQALTDLAGRMLEEGADFLDLGACSTRPGATAVDPVLEEDRMRAGIAQILTHFPAALVSADTYRAAVARASIQQGACMINDISGGTLDPAMHPTLLELQVPYILGHLRGTPATMQQHTDYHDVASEVFQSLLSSATRLRSQGAADLLLDPCFGFAKTIPQNFELLARLPALTAFDYPVVVGLSRKSMIYKTLGLTPEQALNGSTALHSLALAQGAAILRVHDPAQARECIQLWSHLRPHFDAVNCSYGGIR